MRIFSFPAQQPPVLLDCLLSDKAHCIAVDFRTKKLVYVKGGIPALHMDVVTPDPQILDGKMVRGDVIAIELNPRWWSSESIRLEYLKSAGEELRHDIPPLDPQNAMGVSKFIIDWVGTFLRLSRIHGTERYPTTWWDEAAHGCVRIQNDWILALIEKIGYETSRAYGSETVCYSIP